MKKFFILFGAISFIFLILSNATAVPQLSTEAIIINVSDYKLQITLIEEKLQSYIEKLSGINPKTQPKGIILNIIVAIVNFLISVINSLIGFIKEFWNLLKDLVEAIGNLISLINQFIEWLIGLFTPGCTIAI